MTAAHALGDETYTLLGVRADGVAPTVDLVTTDDLSKVLTRARAFLAEHASCDSVEVWKGPVLVERVLRG